jgi:hypothetical protein
MRDHQLNYRKQTGIHKKESRKRKTKKIISQLRTGNGKAEEVREGRKKHEIITSMRCKAKKVR